MRTALLWCVIGAAAFGVGCAREAYGAFAEIEVSPRAVALGASTSAIRMDEYAAFHNPATLAWVTRPGGAGSFVRPFGYDFSSQSAIAGSTALPKGLGGVAIGIRHFGVDYLGTSLTSENTFSLAHGFQLLRDNQSELAVGWALSVYSLSYGLSTEIQQGSGTVRIDPGTATTLGFNVGAVAVVRDRTRIGFQAVNLNNPRIGNVDHEDLPCRVSVGVSYMAYAGVETVFDIANELGAPIQYRGGAEFEVGKVLLLRVGVHSEPSVLTAGFGIRHAGLSIDYGMATGGGVLPETHHIGIGYTLPGAK
jgi:hypothetical protein